MGCWVHSMWQLVFIKIAVLMTPIKVYQIESGSELISARGSLNDYFFRAVQLGGPQPDSWLDIWNTRSGHVDGMLHFHSLLLYMLEHYTKTWPGTDGRDLHSRDEAWGKHRLVVILGGCSVMGRGNYSLTWSKNGCNEPRRTEYNDRPVEASIFWQCRIRVDLCD